MGERSAIEWTDATWNPTRGCTKISAGCRHCYAERFAERFRGIPHHPYEHGFDLRLAPDAVLDLPFRWKRPRMVFVNSMSDLFHEGVPYEFIDKVFAVMKACPDHTFQVLTKRAARMREFFTRAAPDLAGLPNVWLGVSVENQPAADGRIPHLLKTPAAVRFLSCEPLLAPVDLGLNLGVQLADGSRWQGSLPLLDWVIVGGESGHRARPCHLAWIRDLVGQAQRAFVPVFVKQLGSHAVAGFYDQEARGLDWLPEDWDERDGQPTADAIVRLRLSDHAGREPLDWPEDLRIRQMPTPRSTP